MAYNGREREYDDQSYHSGQNWTSELTAVESPFENAETYDPEAHRRESVDPFAHDYDEYNRSDNDEDFDELEDDLMNPDGYTSQEGFTSQDSNVSNRSYVMFPLNRGQPLSKRYESVGLDEFGHEYIVEGSSVDSSDSAGHYEALYPSWTAETNAPVLTQDIESIFIEFSSKFGFQWDSMRNMFDYFMVMLDSRASRMAPRDALATLHADYIGGPNANFKKWYFAAGMDRLDLTSGSPSFISQDSSGVIAKDDLKSYENLWYNRMEELTDVERVEQLSLYMLCWGEANNVRFMPECLCFIYKCAYDYFLSAEYKHKKDSAPQDFYLDHCITPIYQLLHDEQFEIVNGKFTRRERDHAKIIGYDDVNQTFWYMRGIRGIKLFDGTCLIDAPAPARFHMLYRVDWRQSVHKSFREIRSLTHFIVNFTRIWVLHLSIFWYFIAYNSPTMYTKNYHHLLYTQPAPAARWTACGIAGAVASFIVFVSLLLESVFVPRTAPGTQSVFPRLLFMLILMAVNIAPAVYILGYCNLTEQYESTAKSISHAHFWFSIVCVLYLSFVPQSSLLGSRYWKSSRKYLAHKYFTASYVKLPFHRWCISAALWTIVFGAKFVESYFFLTLSAKDPIRFLHTMKPYYCYDYIIGDALCKHQPRFILALVYITELVLFFLDSYLWYMLVCTMFSIAYSFYLGITIWTPWSYLFSNIPRRMYNKILATDHLPEFYKPKIYIAQLWNSIIISMYREHLLTMEHLKKLLFQPVDSEQSGKRTFKTPSFFFQYTDRAAAKMDYFPKNSEAERRISFFAQSLSCRMPATTSVAEMPTFTVLIPHYGEKILLSLREIIREQDPMSRITLLEYLKQLYPNEWEYFVRDTKLLAGEMDADEATTLKTEKGKKGGVTEKVTDLPFYCIGFKSNAPEYTLRTRIWASLRSQTLYRTASGMMNYTRALKLLYRVENPQLSEECNGDPDKVDYKIEQMAFRKFRLCISMQRYAKFNQEENENAEFMLRAHPELQIAYLDSDPVTSPDEEPRLYATLINGFCPFKDGRRLPKYRIRLSGNPILGDGKADNQNMSLPFIRGEYLQLIDANQDNYIEECLKIRSMLAEFEEMEPPACSPYSPELMRKHPVAMLGSREYIFSENSGILGDVAAGKEQTFGTLFSRALALIGGKLHYGHPDILNTIFMTTRGGVSKAQKGLHVNEDIYAGMTVLQRGGQIKHCEYFQCGKGRDLGFGTILNFTTKIGTGMGEQTLSREYFNLGTQLPLHRLLAFFYAHAGFHLNNVFIMVSIQLIMLVILNLGAMYKVVTVCHYTTSDAINAAFRPSGCYQLKPLLDWLRRCIISIFIVFFVAFLPLITHDLVDKGAPRAIKRLTKQICSLSPMFEVFVTQIYAQSIITNFSYGGARYIATGRGFATTRVPFSTLYSRFAAPSIYVGTRMLLMLLFGTLTVWTAHYIYFWITLYALCVSPFIYNPHQFAWTDFFVDYREFMRWLTRGNTKSHSNSWIAFCQLTRTRITGFRRQIKGRPSNKISMDSPRAKVSNLFVNELFLPACAVFFTLAPYVFMNSQPGNPDPEKSVNSFIRIFIMSGIPVAASAASAIIFSTLSLCCGPLFRKRMRSYGSLMAAFAHAVSIVALFFTFEALWFLEAWSFSKTVLGCIVIMTIERFFFKVVTIFMLTRDQGDDNANLSWWNGDWFEQNSAHVSFVRVVREFVCKTTELNLFSTDFVLGHMILFSLIPLLLVPYIDVFHSMLLFWLQPKRQIRAPIYTMKQNRLRRLIFFRYSFVFLLILAFFVAAIIVPFILDNQLSYSFTLDKSKGFGRLMQPSDQDWSAYIGNKNTSA
ncbi:1,3-beta-glucan synthase subunit Bgs3 [Schizosaccharomyces japonicus yFS275]|uniref:1,3-beta-glucan synthase n=1 Tax=Schizosaccharomyces japonicus (strain yFS275 / FY16936) TaxID=402676 RepID=B6K096_SCHJY|nr:1,3-beta-glucan synthase subunit Bgs3 [Schizosaccharomyces japonicus yFS275]EEB06246.2 1,3-beta-glucan synthase subunit Bgs3 [Schizosaccharomyces japonicus yFS275]